MSRTFILSVLLFCFLQTEGKTVSFSESTCSSYYVVTSDSDIYLVWDGGRVEEDCEVTFSPLDNSETVCVEAESFNIVNCNVKVKYSTDYFMTTKTYGCSTSPQKFCGGKNDDVQITMSIGSKLFSSNDANSFKLRIYNPVKTDYVWIIVFVGLAVGFVVCTIVIALVCRRKRSAGTVLRTSGIPHTRLVNCPDSAPFNSTEQQPYPSQQPVTREYTITVPVAVNI